MEGSVRGEDEVKVETSQAIVAHSLSVSHRRLRLKEVLGGWATDVGHSISTSHVYWPPAYCLLLSHGGLRLQLRTVMYIQSDRLCRGGP